MHVRHNASLVASLMAVLLLVGAGCAQEKPTQQDSTMNDTPNQETSMQADDTTSTEPTVLIDAEPQVLRAADPNAPETSEPEVDPVTTFRIGGENFAFLMDGEENPTLRVKEGELVRIIFTSESGFHDWKVDEFDAATEKVQAGGTTEVEFVPNKKGTFEYYCSVGQHRANGMKGMLIVE